MKGIQVCITNGLALFQKEIMIISTIDLLLLLLWSPGRGLGNNGDWAFQRSKYTFFLNLQNLLAKKAETSGIGASSCSID